MKYEGKIKYIRDCLWFINIVVKYGWFVIRIFLIIFSVYLDNIESFLKEYIYVYEFIFKLKKKSILYLCIVGLVMCICGIILW